MMSDPIFELEDLETLVQEPEDLPFEINPLNHYHGASAIIRKYASIPVTEPLAFGIEHYIPFDRSVPHHADFSAELPIYLATTRARARVYKKNGMKDARPAGFAYYYARQLFRERYGGEPVKKSGTVIFPHKSTKNQDRDFNREDFAARIAALPDEFHPVTVCLYWKDALRGMADLFRRHGFKVVTCGHFLHPDFLLRFHDLCRRHRFACSNTIATSFPLSILSGCYFFYLDTGKLTVKSGAISDQYERDPFLDPSLARRALTLSAFPPRAFSGMFQKPLAQLIAGGMWTRSPGCIRNWHREGRQALLQSQEESWRPSSSTQSEGLSKWLPVGVDWDGWACHQGSITFRGGKRSQTNGILLLFVVASPDIEGLTVIIPHRSKKEGKDAVKLSSGFHRIVFPLMCGGEPTEITWKSQGDIQISSADPRWRPFRIGCLKTSDDQNTDTRACTSKEVDDYFR